MRIGVLGTGMVGHALATRLIGLGHEVRMGSRQAGNEKAVAWAQGAGDGASEGTFGDAAGFGELVVNCTAGVASLDALEAAGGENLAGKVLIERRGEGFDFRDALPYGSEAISTKRHRAFARRICSIVRAFTSSRRGLATR
jgi:8-hydroxy-5-deazaflavin:NADPH oxidoreductase